MKVFSLFVLLCLLTLVSLNAQVKIGDNPEVIHQASVLELQSNDKAFVIPRMTTTQMNAITPLEGALVYNTNLDCVHYFNGIQWINLCQNGGTNGTIVSTAPDNAITNNNGAYYSDTYLQTQITTNKSNMDNHIISDEDKDAANELTDLQLNGSIISLSNALTSGNQIDIAPLLGSGGGSNLSNTNLTQATEDRTYNLNNQNLNFSGAGTVAIGDFGGNTPTDKLHVAGNVRINGHILDSDGDTGNPSELLSATATGTNWVSANVNSPFHAFGKYNGVSPLNAQNVAFASSFGTGIYQVEFSTSASSNHYIINVSVLNSSEASIVITSQTTSGFTVRIYDNSGALTDSAWYFSIIDL